MNAKLKKLLLNNMTMSAFFIILIVFINGCATTPPKPKTPNDVFLQSKVETNPYLKTTLVFSPGYSSRVTLKSTIKDEGFYVAALSATIIHKKISNYCLGVSDTASNWRFYSYAQDAKNGMPLGFKVIDREVKSNIYGGSPSTEEYFEISLTREYLEKSKDSGLNIEVMGLRGKRTIIIPATYVQGFPKKVDSVVLYSKVIDK